MFALLHFLGRGRWRGLAKQGKEKAFNCYQKARKSDTTYEEVERGIYAYKEYIRINDVDMQYIKMGSTFFSQKAWQDDWTARKKSNNPFMDMLANGEF